MEQDKEDAVAAREAELSEVLAAYAEAPPVGFGFVVGFVVLGLLACAALAGLTARAPRSTPLRFEPEVGASFRSGVQAFRAGEWAEALRVMRDARQAQEQPIARVEDYIVRLELIEQDEQHLVQVERAISRGDAQGALLLAALIAPNSPLFAQTESLGRRARALLAQETATEPPAAPPAAMQAAVRRATASKRALPSERARPPTHGQAREQDRDQSAW